MHLSDKNVLKIEYKKKSFAINKFYRAISSIFYNVIFFFWENMKQICTTFIETSVKIVFLNFLIRTISLFTSISVHSPVLLFYIKFFHTQTVFHSDENGFDRFVSCFLSNFPSPNRIAIFLATQNNSNAYYSII